MADRTEQLLSDILEVLRRQVANQEQALTRQEDAIAMQREVVARQRKALRWVWMLMIFVLALIAIPYAISWGQWFARR